VSGRLGVKPLGANERKAVLLVELYQRERGQGPPWALIRDSLGVDHFKLAMIMIGLRRKGCLEFSDDGGPGSTRATAAGVALALKQGRAK
jgi:hypothetical protein